jgi:hypothetical protein
MARSRKGLTPLSRRMTQLSSKEPEAMTCASGPWLAKRSPTRPSMNSAPIPNGPVLKLLDHGKPKVNRHGDTF